MKRPALPPRHSWLPRRQTPITRSGITRTRRTPIKARGPAKAKKEARYKAFLSSAAWKRLRKAALVRAGHQCEGEREYLACDGHGIGICISTTRCWETEKLTVHHKTYARFGGKELPEDLQVLCKSCHDRHSALTGKRIA